MNPRRNCFPSWKCQSDLREPSTDPPSLPETEWSAPAISLLSVCSAVAFRDQCDFCRSYCSQRASSGTEHAVGGGGQVHNLTRTLSTFELYVKLDCSRLRFLGSFLLISSPRSPALSLKPAQAGLSLTDCHPPESATLHTCPPFSIAGAFSPFLQLAF